MSTSLTPTMVNGELRIRDLDLGVRLGFDRPSKIRELIKRNEEKLKVFSVIPTVGRRVDLGDGASKEVQEYYLTQKQSIFICMKSETDNAFDVQVEIVHVFDAHLNGAQLALPQDYSAALRALADATDAKLAAERDNALLNTIIDNEFGYSSILRAAQHLGIHESAFQWKVLKKATLEAGLEIKQVPSPRFKYQNLYPIRMFERCYPQYDFTGLQPEAVATRAVKLFGGQVMTVSH